MVAWWWLIVAVVATLFVCAFVVLCFLVWASSRPSRW